MAKQLGIGPLLNFYNRLEKNDIYHKIAGILLQNMNRLGDMTILEAADLCYTSTATISRMAKKAGYDGFNALKEEARRHCAGYFQENRVLSPEQLVNADTTETYISTVIQMFMETSRTLDRKAINKAVALIDAADAVYYFGTCDVARRFQQDLNFNGKYVEVYQVFSADSPHLIEWAKNSVAIIENPGYPWFRSNEMVLKIKESGTKVILIACASQPELEEKVDTVLLMPGSKSGRDEVLYHALMTILSIEYRKQCMDAWYYK